MMSSALPIYTATIDGFPVRFFAPAKPPGFPWVALSDLLALIDTPPGNRGFYEEDLPRSFPDDVAAIVTERGPEKIVSHHIARGAIDARAEVLEEDEGLFDAYLSAEFGAITNPCKPER